MTGKPLSRRDFLKAAGVTLGASALACSGLTQLTSQEPEIEFPENSYGENTMSNKILVAYASHAGSTAGVAEAIGKTLAENGFSVDVRQMKEVKDLSPYRAVVAGSAIHSNEWLPEAMDFLKANRSTLAKMPFAAFMVCITLAMPSADKYREAVKDWMEPVRRVVRPASEGFFAGTLDFSKVPLFWDGVSLRILSAATKTPEGDYRDWEAISSWAESLSPLLAL